jgi:hypothetical protein
LLDIAALDILHECGIFENLVDSLDGLGHDRLRTQKSGLGDLKLFGSNVVEGVALFILEIPVLAILLASAMRGKEVADVGYLPDPNQGHGISY